MPTTRPRLTVTETDDVARALDVAARRWPGERRQQLLLRLVEEGRRAVDAERDERVGRRRAAIERVSGKYTGLYAPGYLDGLRAGWDR